MILSSSYKIVGSYLLTTLTVVSAVYHLLLLIRWDCTELPSTSASAIVTELDDKVDQQATDATAQLQDELIKAAARERQLLQELDKMKDDVNWLRTQLNQEAERSQNLSLELEMRRRESKSYSVFRIKGHLYFFISSLAVDLYKRSLAGCRLLLIEF